MSSGPNQKPFASVTGGASPRQFATVEPSAPAWFSIEHDDEELKAIDLAHLSAKEQEELWGPDFYGRSQDEHTEFAQKNNKSPVICLTSGRYKFDLKGVPVTGCKLQCGSCRFFAVYDSWGQMTSSLPAECGRLGKKTGPGGHLEKNPDPDCPLYRGKMKRQYEARGF